MLRAPYLGQRPGGKGPLLRLLKPVMWRNSKAVAAQDHPLPPRRLQVGAALRRSFVGVTLGVIVGMIQHRAMGHVTQEL